MSGKKKPDGGPAFPGGGLADHGNISVRDWFAGRALQGAMANPKISGTFDEIARDSFLQADAMIAERSK